MLCMVALIEQLLSDAKVFNETFYYTMCSDLAHMYFRCTQMLDHIIWLVL